VEAALTGHKVFATFHTEDAVGAVLRLTDMGVEPFLASSTLACVVAQRLVRRVCGRCKEPGEPSREDLRFLGLERSQLAGAEIVRARGCPACSGTGFKGRVGIHEVLIPDDDFRDAILRRAASKEMRAMARHLHGFLTLQESGLMKALAGHTTLSEVVANAPRDPAPRVPAALREIAGQGRDR
jgi:type IV pilus assembly protein PilB